LLDYSLSAKADLVASIRSLEYWGMTP